MLKYILLISVVLATAYTQNIDVSSVLESKFDQYTTSVDSIADKIKAAKCVANSYAEVKEVISFAQNIIDGNIIGDFVDAYKAIKNLFNLLDNCSVLFCFGPTYKKCEADHPQGCEKWGLIVYPKCKEGYTNWDCCVCATVCPADFRDDGLYCAKPKAYGRGAGYVLWKKDKCFQDHPDLGCEKNGALWYPKCKPGFHNVGCCICSPNCPDGWTDIGVSCKKPSSYGRGVGYAVSFGLKCLDQKKAIAPPSVQQTAVQVTSADNCSQQLDYLKQLVNQAQTQLDNTKQNPDQYQDYFPDNVTHLDELLQQYISECTQQQISQ